MSRPQQVLLPGLMMDVDLNVALLLRRMRAVHHGSRVISRSATRPDGPSRSITFREVLDRAERLSAGLAQLGVKPGDRVGTLAWNTQEHLESYYAVVGMGAVLHTANPRLHEDQLVYTINHARDAVLIIEASFQAQVDASAAPPAARAACRGHRGCRSQPAWRW